MEKASWWIAGAGEGGGRGPCRRGKRKRQYVLHGATRMGTVKESRGKLKRNEAKNFEARHRIAIGIEEKERNGQSAKS